MKAWVRGKELNNKPIYPDIAAIAYHDDLSNLFVVKDSMRNGTEYSFGSRQWQELRLAAIQDLLFRIDNFERSPTPPALITKAHVIHVRERNAVSVINLEGFLETCEFSAPQWRAICMAADSRLLDRLDDHVQGRKAHIDRNEPAKGGE